MLSWYHIYICSEINLQIDVFGWSIVWAGLILFISGALGTIFLLIWTISPVIVFNGSRLSLVFFLHIFIIMNTTNLCLYIYINFLYKLLL